MQLLVTHYFNLPVADGQYGKVRAIILSFRFNTSTVLHLLTYIIYESLLESKIRGKIFYWGWFDGPRIVPRIPQNLTSLSASTEQVFIYTIVSPFGLIRSKVTTDFRILFPLAQQGTFM